MNNNKHIDEVAGRVDFFDEHWYKSHTTGELYPSVTRVLGLAIAKGYGYDEWLKTAGHEANYVVREAQQSGSKIHKAIEDLLSGEEIRADLGDFNKSEWVKVNCWVDWFKHYNPKCLMMETPLVSEVLKVGGTLDAVMEINGEKWLLDWKTGNSIYPTSDAQVACYAKILEEIKGIKVDRAGVVHIGANIVKFNDEKLQAPKIKVSEVDINKNYEMFKHALGIYGWLYPKDKAPTLEFPLKLKIKGE